MPQVKNLMALCCTANVAQEARRVCQCWPPVKKVVIMQAVAARSERDKEEEEFKTKVNKLHPSLKRVFGQYRYRRLPTFRGNSGVMVATDGSAKHYQGGALVVIDDDKGGRYVSVLPVDGNLDDMDSFCAELYSILSALVVLDILVQMKGVKGRVKKIRLWIDSQASITAIKNTL